MSNENGTPKEVAGDAIAAAMPREVAVLCEESELYVIDSPAMFDAAATQLQEVVTKKKKIEEKRVELIAPILAAQRGINAFFKGYTDKLEVAERFLKGGMLTYQNAEREKAARAQREAEARAAAERAEAEKAAREAEAAARAAEAEGNTEAAAEAYARAEVAQEAVMIAEVAPPAVVRHITPKAKGISTRSKWKAEVTDIKALVLYAAERIADGDEFPLTFLCADQKALDTAASGMRAKLTIPGVRAYEEQNIAARRN